MSGCCSTPNEQYLNWNVFVLYCSCHLKVIKRLISLSEQVQKCPHFIWLFVLHAHITWVAFCRTGTNLSPYHLTVRVAWTYYVSECYLTPNILSKNHVFSLWYDSHGTRTHDLTDAMIACYPLHHVYCLWFDSHGTRTHDLTDARRACYPLHHQCGSVYINSPHKM